MITTEHLLIGIVTTGIGTDTITIATETTIVIEDIDLQGVTRGVKNDDRVETEMILASGRCKVEVEVSDGTTTMLMVAGIMTMLVVVTGGRMMTGIGSEVAVGKESEARKRKAGGVEGEANHRPLHKVDLDATIRSSG